MSGRGFAPRRAGRGSSRPRASRDRRSRPGPPRLQRRLRGGRLQPARAARAQLRRAGRGQHAHARAQSRPRSRSERYLAPLAARRGPLLLRDDRAGARRRLRPVDAPHHAARGGRRLGHRRATRGSSPAPTAPRSRSAWPAPASGSPATRARRCSWSTPTTPASASAGASPRSTSASLGGHSEVPFGTAGRADAVLGEAGRGLPLRAGAARPGAADPLHALARPRAARARHRPRPRRRARGVRRRLAGPRHGAGAIADAVIDLDSSRGADPAGAPGCSTRAPRHARVVGRQGPRARGRGPGRRPGGPDLRRARRLGRPPARAATSTEVRPFRIYDGPSEAHRWAIARRAVSRRRQQREGAP